jgi:peptidoglycan/xylan/chitin deacetylase (PgdA/CDA1 family)
VSEELRAQAKVILTFDIEGLPPTEDCFDHVSAMYVNETLDLLEEKGFKGIFFLTGIVAERIRTYPEIVRRLALHEIGYHSSSHVRPTITEYTDVANYEEAVATSLKRETSHIDPETGQMEGKGGILALRETFPRNHIRCFRAPFLAWSPPHLEALKQLGIMFDFSSSISDDPISFRGISFYPYPIPIDGVARTFVHKKPENPFLRPITSTLLRRKATVLLMHPSNLPIQNPFATPDKVKISGKVRTKFAVSFLRLLLDRIHLLQRTNRIEVAPALSENWPTLRPEKIDAERIYRISVQEVKHLFTFNPCFLLSHFKRFFD